MALTSLSIFFPAYHDENTVEPLTRALIAVASTLTDDYEIIIVDDASPDRTGQIADRLAGENPRVRVVHHPENRGVGEAMISGYRESSKDWVFYTDGDMQYDVSELTLLAAHAAKYDVIAGYRLNRAEGFLRFFTSRCFHVLAFLFFGLRFRDIDCSFKLIHRRVLDQIRFSTGGGLIDTEMLLQARKLAPIKEVPVHHYNRKFGRSQCLNHRLVFSMLHDLVVLRFRMWRQG